MTDVPQHRHPYLRNHVDYTDAFLMAKFPGEYVPPGEEEPPPRLPLIGAATWTPADFLELEALCSVANGAPVVVPVRRAFDNADQWDVTRMSKGQVAADIAAGRTSVVSWTNYPSDAALITIRDTTPAGHRLSLAFKHEVDREKDTPTGHADQMARISAQVRAWGRPEITTRTVFTGYGGEAQSGQRVRRWLDAGIASIVDHISIDPYNTYLYNGQQKWTHPVELLTPWTVLADEYGFRGRMAIDEYSCPEHPAGPEWKVADLAQLVAIADAETMPWFTYFDVQYGEISDGADHRIKSSPEHLAAFAGYAAR